MKNHVEPYVNQKVKGLNQFIKMKELSFYQILGRQKYFDLTQIQANNKEDLFRQIPLEQPFFIFDDAYPKNNSLQVKVFAKNKLLSTIAKALNKFQVPNCKRRTFIHTEVIYWSKKNNPESQRGRRALSTHERGKSFLSRSRRSRSRSRGRRSERVDLVSDDQSRVSSVFTNALGKSSKSLITLRDIN